MPMLLLCRRWRSSRGSEQAPLVVAVLDSGGNLVAYKREDGSGLMRFDIAFGKAWGSLGMGMSTRLIRDRLAQRPVFQGLLHHRFAALRRRHIRRNRCKRRGRFPLATHTDHLRSRRQKRRAHRRERGPLREHRPRDVRAEGVG